MYYIAAMGAAIGMGVGIVRRGSFKALADLPLQMWWLLPLALAMQALLIAWPLGEMDPKLAGTLHSSSYVVLLAVVVANRRLPGVPVVGLGLAMNTLVIVANGGFIPVNAGALAMAGQQHRIETLSTGPSEKSQLASDSTVLAFLGDWLPVPRPIGKVFSPGDLVLGLGCALFFAGGMTRRTLEPAPSLVRANQLSIRR